MILRLVCISSFFYSLLTAIQCNTGFQNPKFPFRLHTTTNAVHDHMFQTKVAEKIERHFIFNSYFPDIVPSMGCCGKTWHSQTGHR
jgi:hypothetical protein